MTLCDLIRAKHASQHVRANTLYWLRNGLSELGADDQAKVVAELIGDLRQSLDDYKHEKNKVVALKPPQRAK